MAYLVPQDPKTSIAYSTLIAGMSEALTKITQILDLSTETHQNVTMENVFVDITDMNRIYQAPPSMKNWLSYPAPIVRKNGSIISQSTNFFEIDHIGGAIIFDDASRLLDNDIVTVDVTVLKSDSITINDITAMLDEAIITLSHNKGYFVSPAALRTSFPVGAEGDYAIVGGNNDTFWIWQNDVFDWVDTGKETDLSNYYTKSETDDMVSLKENSIIAHGDTVASDNFYYSGRKSWLDILSKIRSTTLTGLDIEPSGDRNISATDNILSALGRLQKMINLKAENTNATPTKTGLMSADDKTRIDFTSKQLLAVSSNNGATYQIDTTGYTDISNIVMFIKFNVANTTTNPILEDTNNSYNVLVNENTVEIGTIEPSYLYPCVISGGTLHMYSGLFKFGTSIQELGFGNTSHAGTSKKAAAEDHIHKMPIKDSQLSTSSTNVIENRAVAEAVNALNDSKIHIIKGAAAPTTNDDGSGTVPELWYYNGRLFVHRVYAPNNNEWIELITFNDMDEVLLPDSNNPVKNKTVTAELAKKADSFIVDDLKTEIDDAVVRIDDIETDLNDKQAKITANGILKGNGSTVTAAVAGTDYTTPTNVDNKINTHNNAGNAHADLFNNKLDKSGGTLTGDLILTGNATQSLQAVPLQQLNSAIQTAILDSWEGAY